MSKFLDKQGVQTLWAKTKGLVDAVDAKVDAIDVTADIATAIKTNVTDKLGAANGLATLGSDSKLPASQLPALKTVNGESIVGSGNIAIDLNIYQVVESLPESNQNPNKIYLVLSETSGEYNLYTEYIWINSKWEKFGEYKADVDLTPYVKKNELDTLVGEAGYIKENAVDAKVTALGYAKTNDIEEKGYQNATQVQEAIAKAVTGGTLDLSGYVKFTDTASANKAGAMSTAMFNKLSGIADEATKDEAISDQELAEILV